VFGLSVTDLPGSPRRSSIPSAFAGHLIDVPADTEDGEDIVGFVSIVGVVSDTVIVGGSGGGEYPEPPVSPVHRVHHRRSLLPQTWGPSTDTQKRRVP